MDQNKSRDIILGRISKALESRSTGMKLIVINHNYETLYVHGEGSKSDLFIESVSELGVKVFRCENVNEFEKQFQQTIDANGWVKMNCADRDLFESLQLETIQADWTDDTMDCHIAVTRCEIMVARTGTIVMDASQVYGRILPVHTPVQVIVGHENQLVDDLPDAFESIHSKYRNGYPSALFFSSGVSSTGDIEKTLVRGVHGPEEVYVFLLKNNFSKHAD